MRPTLTEWEYSNMAVMIPERADKDTRHRLRLYADWLNETKRHWSTPDLAAYRDALLTVYRGRDDEPLSASSVRAHLSTVRGRYTRIIKDNNTRDLLYRLTPKSANPADRKAVVDEMLTRIKNAIDPDAAPVKVVTSQDSPDAAHLRLTGAQASTLMAQPGTDTLMGLRDTSLIALMLCTGIREAELCALEVRDLRQRLGGELALHVRSGKGAKERLIPYGDLDFVLAILDAWMQNTGIQDEAVFRGFYKGAKRVRPTPLTLRAVNQIMDRYPIVIDGMLQTVKPHDLRRTYARRLYEAGVDLLAIRDNLGHADTRTTLNYIGNLDADKRRPPVIYHFDLSSLGG